MKLKILVWNLQDLFIFMDKYQGEDLSTLSEPKWQLLTTSFKISKPLDKIWAMRDLIQKVSPDICLFTEVGGRESLENFNKYFLDEEFEIVHHDTNSNRGIDIGMMVKKDLPHSYKHTFHAQKVFARGVLELNIEVNNKHLHFLLTHLKSKLNLKGKDFEGRSQREREVLQLIDIAKDILSKENTNVFIAGDLNGIIVDEEATEPELGHFANKLGLVDAMKRQNRPNFECCTYIYYNKQSEGIMMQLDYFLMQDTTANLLCEDSMVLDFTGNVRTNYPKNFKEKMAHPSDHFPLFINLDLDKL